MSDDTPNADRLLDLAGRICDQRASETELAEMDACLLDDPALRNRYLKYCWLHVALTMDFQTQRAVRQVHEKIDTQPARPALTAAREWDAPEIQPLVSPALSSPATPWHATVAYFSSGWPVAYLVATMILGVGLIVGAIVHVSQPGQFVGPGRSLEAPNPQSPTPNPSTIVARITGMVDCEWEGSGFRVPGSGAANHQSEIINHKPAIHLGDRLALRSGLLELTYDAGAKVILQGPVTYEVESPSGGYLSVGKLTAKLEQKSEVSGQRSEPANQKAESKTPLTSGLFAVRTPTAIVTDLGTEFGVEVNKSGETTSHVFRGSVRFSPFAAGKENKTDAVVLRENESIQTRRSPDAPKGHVLLIRTSVDPHGFVRSVPSSRKPAVKSLDLSDIVAGGDGRLRRRENAPPASKVRDTLLTSMAQHNDDSYFSSTDMIDRVFLPDGAQGTVRLDSARHSSSDFPKLVGKQSGSVWATAAGDIGLRPNVGITFDLKAMRERHPGARPNRFRSKVFSGLAAGVTTLFRDDFQSDTAGTMPRDEHRDLLPAIGAGDVGGDWDSTPAAGRFLQVWNNVNPGQPANDPGANNYVKVQRSSLLNGDKDGRLWASGWTANVAACKKLELRFSLWKDSTSETFAGVDAFADQALGGRSFNAYFQPNGRVLYYNGEEIVDTGIAYRLGTWQNVIIKADMSTQTFSLTVEGATADNLHWNQADNNVVNDILFGNGDASKGQFFVDNVTLTATSGLTAFPRLASEKTGQRNFWVFVDGRLKLKRLGVRANDAATPVDVDIGSNDRFLTLVSTNSGDDTAADWIVWQDALINMVAVDPDTP